MLEQDFQIFKKGSICFAKYSLANISWMTESGLYNLPIPDEREEMKEILRRISYFELFLEEPNFFRRARFYGAGFWKEVSYEELLKLNYPRKEKAHSENYFLFRIESALCLSEKWLFKKNFVGGQIVYLPYFKRGDCEKFAQKIESKNEKALAKLKEYIPQIVPEAPILCVI